MISNTELLEGYEIKLNNFRNDYSKTPWYYFRKRYKLKDEIKRYEQLCLMTFMLSMMDRIEEKKE